MQGPIVVFGGSGFIASHLFEFLKTRGVTDIVSVDIKDPKSPVSGVEYRIADVRDLKNFSVPANTERFYNLAAVHTTPGHPDNEYYETNVAGALEVTRLATRAGVREIIFTSSISVYGPSEEMKTEESVLKPTSSYGFSKMLAERVHQDWASVEPSRKLTIVRPSVVFGPGEGGNFTRLAKLMKKGSFVYPGRRDTIKACVYVEDLLDAIDFARAKTEQITTFNAAYPERYTLEQIVGTFSSRHFPRVKTVTIPRAVVMIAAAVLKKTGGMKLGVHPERVLKLVRSTDIFPGWLASKGYRFPDNLERALEKWSLQTHGRFE